MEQITDTMIIMFISPQVIEELNKRGNMVNRIQFTVSDKGILLEFGYIAEITDVFLKSNRIRLEIDNQLKGLLHYHLRFILENAAREIGIIRIINPYREFLSKDKKKWWDYDTLVKIFIKETSNLLSQIGEGRLNKNLVSFSYLNDPLVWEALGYEPRLAEGLSYLASDEYHAAIRIWSVIFPLVNKSLSSIAEFNTAFSDFEELLKLLRVMPSFILEEKTTCPYKESQSSYHLYYRLFEYASAIREYLGKSLMSTIEELKSKGMTTVPDMNKEYWEKVLSSSIIPSELRKSLYSLAGSSMRYKFDVPITMDKERVIRSLGGNKEDIAPHLEIYFKNFRQWILSVADYYGYELPDDWSIINVISLILSPIMGYEIKPEDELLEHIKRFGRLKGIPGTSGHYELLRELGLDPMKSYTEAEVKHAFPEYVKQNFPDIVKVKATKEAEELGLTEADREKFIELKAKEATERFKRVRALYELYIAAMERYRTRGERGYWNADHFPAPIKQGKYRAKVLQRNGVTDPEIIKANVVAENRERGIEPITIAGIDIKLIVDWKIISDRESDITDGAYGALLKEAFTSLGNEDITDLSSLFGFALKQLRTIDPAYTERLINILKERPELILALLDKSPNLAENCIADGLIGINKALFDAYKNDQISAQTFLIALAVATVHELGHEAFPDLKEEERLAKDIALTNSLCSTFNLIV